MNWLPFHDLSTLLLVGMILALIALILTRANIRQSRSARILTRLLKILIVIFAFCYLINWGTRVSVEHLERIWGHSP